MREATWDVVDRGRVPPSAVQVPFDCPGCGHTAMLPVVGRVIAQAAEGLVFDPGEHFVPTIIRCRRCRRRFEA